MSEPSSECTCYLPGIMPWDSRYGCNAPFHLHKCKCGYIGMGSCLALRHVCVCDRWGYCYSLTHHCACNSSRPSYCRASDHHCSCRSYGVTSCRVVDGKHVCLCRDIAAETRIYGDRGERAAKRYGACRAVAHDCTCLYAVGACRAEEKHVCSCCNAADACRAVVHDCSCHYAVGTCRAEEKHDCSCHYAVGTCRVEEKWRLHFCVCVKYGVAMCRAVTHNCACSVDIEHCTVDDSRKHVCTCANDVDSCRRSRALDHDCTCARDKSRCKSLGIRRVDPETGEISGTCRRAPDRPRMRRCSCREHAAITGKPMDPKCPVTVLGMSPTRHRCVCRAGVSPHLCQVHKAAGS